MKRGDIVPHVGLITQTAVWVCKGQVKSDVPSQNVQNTFPLHSMLMHHNATQCHTEFLSQATGILNYLLHLKCFDFLLLFEKFGSLGVIVAN